MKLKTLVIFFVIVLISYGQNILEIKAKDSLDKYNFYPLGDGHVRIEEKLNGKSWVKNFNDISYQNNPNVPSLNIDLNQVQGDSMKYRIWGTVPLSAWQRLVFADADNNGKKEVYGQYRDVRKRQVTCAIYEYDNDSTFKLRYRFPWNDTGYTIFIDAIGDINNDTRLEMITTDTRMDLDVFRQTIPNSLPLEPYFTCNFFKPNGWDQVNDPQLYDIDSDEQTELTFWLLNGSWSLFQPIVISKFNPTIVNFEKIYATATKSYWLGSFSFGDFDMDGKRNLSAGGGYGDWYIIENIDSITYKTKKDSLPCSNLFLTTFTNDMDGNGKPELWVGGDGASKGTIIFIMEPKGDDSYEQVYQINIKGLFSFTVGEMFTGDIDGDGKKEVMLQNGAYVFIFKSKGIHDYELFLTMRNKFTQNYPAYIEGSGCYDIDLDGRDEIYFCHSLYIDKYGFDTLITHFYKLNPLSNTKQETIKELKSYNLTNNYPNPFNMETRFFIEVPESSEITVAVYDILGREVKVLRNECFQKGRYDITWNGLNGDNKIVESGVYFIQMRTNKYTKSIKVMLLK